MGSLRGAIFDLDGTLIDSLDDIADAVNSALPSFDLADVSRDVVRRGIGDGLLTLCRRVAPGLSESDLERLASAVSAHYRRHALDRTRLYPGIDTLLSRLRAAQVPMAVLSNKPYEFTQAIVTALVPPGMFATVRGVSDDAQRKPSPQVALQIAAEWDLKSREVCLIGDSAVDVQTAQAAGMMAVAVTWGFCDVDELGNANPERLIHAPMEIAALFRP